MGSTILAPCLHLLHTVSPILVRVSTRTTSDGEEWLMANIIKYKFIETSPDPQSKICTCFSCTTTDCQY